MIQRDVSRESAAETLWTCRRQGHAGRLLSKGPFHPQIHQVMFIQTDPRGDVRIETGQVSEVDTAAFAFLAGRRQRILVAEKQYSFRAEKKGKRPNRSITKRKEREKERG